MTRIIIPIVAYLLGSIPFGYLIVRGKSGADIRETGSGGTGATNVSRRAGKAAGVLTLLLDAAKGCVAVLIAKAFGGDDWVIAMAAIAALVGHIFPVWLGFRGGKGVATGVGIFLVLAPLALLCAGVVFVAIVFLTRYVSLGSITAPIAPTRCTAPTPTSRRSRRRTPGRSRSTRQPDATAAGRSGCRAGSRRSRPSSTRR